jgi:hypothetical protein
MLSMSRISLPVIALAALGCAVTPARADQIDGQWCSPEGKQVTIAGRAITTPGGTKMEGNYTRHSFSYVIPASEAPAGDTIYMNQLNDTTVQVRVGTPVAQPVIWKRCQNIT